MIRLLKKMQRHPELRGIWEVKAASKTDWMFSQTAHFPHWPFYCDTDRDAANVRSSPFSTLLPISTGTPTMAKLGSWYDSSVQETNISDCLTGMKTEFQSCEVQLGGSVVLSADRTEPRATHNQVERDDKETLSQIQHFNSSCKTTALSGPQN